MIPKLPVGHKFFMGPIACEVLGTERPNHRRSEQHYRFLYRTDLGFPHQGLMPCRFVEQFTGYDQPVAKVCPLCERGFPMVGDYHIPTQSLGMIPNTRCLKRS